MAGGYIWSSPARAILRFRGCALSVVLYNISVKSRTFAAAIAATLLPLALVAVPAHAGTTTYSNALTDSRAHAGEVVGAIDTDGYVGSRGWRSSTFMVGDSVTRQGLVWGFRPQHLAQGWEVSAVSGRNVSTLPFYLEDRVAAQQKLPKVHHSRRWKRHHPRLAVRLAARKYRYPVKRVVIALGTNATPGWSYTDLRRAVNLVPSTATVTFVTPYRDAVKWDDSQPFRVRASVAAVYASWEHRIAEVRPHTCIADWAGFAQRYPWLLPGGVHPSVSGTEAWGRLVQSAVDRCR